jgi:mediator of RNA polymerase II transcription subunit 12
LNALITLPFLELYPSITEHIFDVAIILSDQLPDDVRSHAARLENMKSTNDVRCHFVLGAAAPIDGWLVLTKPVILPLNTQVASQPSTPMASPYHSPQLASSGPSTPQQRYLNQQQQQQQRQQLQQAQQAQQMRSYPQYPQHSMPQNRGLPAQLQRTSSGQTPQSSLQQMQHMQQMQALAQQRATQPSPVHSQRPTPAASQNIVGGTVGGNASSNKSQPGPINSNPQREIRQFPFVQPRWEILAESSGNPNLNETAISLSLFGARKV